MVAPARPGHPALCARASDVPAGEVIPPSVGSTRCTGCGCRLLIAASTLAAVARGECRPVCRGCVPAGRLVPVMTGGQLAELVSFLPDAGA